MPTTIIRCLAIAALGVVLAACGSGGSDTSDLTRAELAAKADAICASALATHLPTRGFVGDAATVAGIYAKVATVMDRQTKALLALRPTADAARDWRAFTTAAVAVDQLAHRERAEAVDGSAGLNDDAGHVHLARRLVATATAIGATTCVKA